MKIGDEVFVHGFVDEIRNDTIIIKNDGGYFGTVVNEIMENSPPVTPTEQNEEDILKFYYVESLDEYWIGQRCGTRYYGKWTGNCFTFGYSRYLPWGEHVVAPDTLWKEHTYPSEPKEIPFNEWLQGFLEKECQTERTGWIPVSEKNPSQTGEYLVTAVCDNGATFTDKFGYTPTTDGGWYDPEAPSQIYIDWNQHIIAWQPLPKPYKGGDTE